MGSQSTTSITPIRIPVGELKRAGFDGPWSNKPSDELLETPIVITAGSGTTKWRSEYGVRISENEGERNLVPDKVSVNIEGF